MKKIGIIFLILLFVGCFNSTNHPSLEPKMIGGSSSKPNELTLLSWNIHMLPSPYGWFSQPRKRAKLIIEKLKQSAHYDVILFQEAFDNKIRDILFEELKYLYPFQIKPADKGEFFKINSGLWALSKLPISLVDEIQFLNAIGWDWIALMGAKLYQLQKNNQDFYIINTHLQSDNGDEYSMVRNSQYTQIQHELIEPNVDATSPLILCGDLNISQIKNLKKMLSFLNLKTGPLSSKLSFSNWTAGLKNPKQLLDYILVKENTFSFETIQRKILEFTNFSNKNKFSMSDHNPIEAIFKWSEK